MQDLNLSICFLSLNAYKYSLILLTKRQTKHGLVFCLLDVCSILRIAVNLDFPRIFCQP